MVIILIVFCVFYTIGIIWEVRHSMKNNLHLYDVKDSAMNLSLGIAVVAIRFVFGGTWLLIWLWVSRFAIFKIEETYMAWLFLFFLHEFVYYWMHRLSHNVRILWAVHVNHHSSQLLNFTTAARMPVLMFLVMMVFWSPLIIIGFNPFMVFAVSNVSFVFAVFQHSQVIGKIPLLEYIFVTPTHHRLHHASNETYINHNYGSVLIIFDRMFGTFKEVNEDEPIKYGIRNNINTNNPVKVIFHEWEDMLKRKKKDTNEKEH